MRKNLVIFLVIFLFMGLLFFKLRDLRKNSFDGQLATFKSLGFEINEGVDVYEMMENWGGEEVFKEEPYVFLYVMLGSTTEKEPWTPVTNQVWHFDIEAIEDTGDYVRIMENLKRISNGELNFENISDVVLIEEKKASVYFDINGDHYDWDLEVNDDWVDGSLFSRVVELTKKYNTKGRLTYFDTGGQSVVLGWATIEQLQAIKKETGLEIVWLE